MTKKTPGREPAKQGGRKRRQITLISANKPDPKIAAEAIMPLLLDFVRRERAKMKEGADNQEK